MIDTDKAAIEMESPADGILSGVRAKLNDVIPVTEVIAYILAPGEALPGKPIPQQVVTIPAPQAAPAPKFVPTWPGTSGKPRIDGSGGRYEP